MKQLTFIIAKHEEPLWPWPPPRGNGHGMHARARTRNIQSRCIIVIIMMRICACVHCVHFIDGRDLARSPPLLSSLNAPSLSSVPSCRGSIPWQARFPSQSSSLFAAERPAHSHTRLICNCGGEGDDDALKLDGAGIKGRPGCIPKIGNYKPWSS